jgi:phosphohistidine phosphatase
MLGPMTAATHRLILLRHAKAASPDGVDDIRRPLADRGRADAEAAASVFTENLPLPDVALCSPALRTRQTWDLIKAHLHPAPREHIDTSLYEASVHDVLAAIGALPEAAGTAVVVGHEPTMSTVAAALAGPGSSVNDLARLKHAYPTTGIALLRFEHGWSQVARHSGELERFLVPRAPSS